MPEAYPLDWPEGQPRAKYRQPSNFGKHNFGALCRRIMNELRLMGARHIVLSTNVGLRLDGLPYANQGNPSDPGVAVYFDRPHGRQWTSYAMACDKWDRIEHNLHAIGKTLDAMRGIERWGVTEFAERSFAGFQAALPAAGSDWRSTLGVTKFDDLDTVHRRYRELAREAHPDLKNGNPHQMLRLNEAWEAAQKELKA
jgi:hypothetical protein